MNGGIFGYEGFVEVNVQIPGRDFSEDHLFLVTSEIGHQKKILFVVGTYFIASLSEYLQTLEKEVFEELDQAIQQAYYSWEEAAKIREKYGCEPLLGVGERKEIHGITKIKHGGYSVNCISEPAMEKALPKGLKLITGYFPLGVGSSRVSNVIENTSDKDITIPAKINSVPQDSEKGNSSEPNSENSEGEDDGSWILNLIDLSGLEDWPEHLQIEAKEMLKRNAKTFSKNDLDMGRTNLVKHHIKLTDPIPFKKAYRRIPLQMYDELKAHMQEMLDLGAIRPSNSPWASAIVLVRKKDGRLMSRPENLGILFFIYFSNIVRHNLVMHRSVTPFIIWQPIHRPHLLERVYKPMRTPH